MIEIWRAVVGYEGYYEVSNFGRVKSLERVDYKGHVRKERILKPAKDKDGYLYINLYKDGTRKIFKVHRLVGMAFADLVDWSKKAKGKPFSELDINHKNQNREINHVENLGWMTHEENNNYGTHNEQVTKANSKTVVQKTKDGEFVREWPSTREIERQTGWSRGFIAACCRGEYEYGYGYKWSYTKKAESA